MAITVDVHLAGDNARSALETDVLEGLTATPKELPPKWFYDDRGSELFAAITRLVEYYPTEAERSILHARAAEIVETAQADTFVELGSGTSDKTTVLLDAMAGAGRLRRYVPFDVSEATLREAGAAMDSTYPGIDVHGVVGDFEHHLDLIPHVGRRMVAFLGGTVGNFDPPSRAEFLTSIAASLEVGDTFLLGTDLVKDPARLVLAYDDPAGVTAAFNKNVLAVVNRELEADFDLDRFEHVALWDADREWIEMRLRSLADQQVRVDAIDLDVRFAEGEQMRTEISAKFRRDGLETELAAAGLDLVGWWTDDAGDFALSLSTPAT
ncbi:MAG TPA: L-histidine N(alpha)-methyltransferase [Acidimicrobiales bacterium]|nr:L-histidine N(alpha)-methyltransferase [Acidimicrobiales bacterium]